MENNLANVLDFMTLINAQDKFMSAAMTFCNEFAARYKCDRVSLGWFEKGYIKLQAISHTDNFDKKSEIVSMLETAMEETFDQDTEIVLPLPKETDIISRDHEQFAKKYDVTYICSIPLRLDDKLVGVCTFERNSSAFSEPELQILNLTCVQSVKRLFDLKRMDRWIGSFVCMKMRESFAEFLGVEHTWLKVLVVFVAIVLGILCFGRFSYRVEALSILRTDNMMYLTTSFDGHIDRVLVEVGDDVKKEEKLLFFDQKELLLEKVTKIAEKNRYEREFEKARALNELADMQISKALYEQTVAQLDLINYRLEKSVISAPFDGVVTEGDLKEKIGAPIKQGEILFKVARCDQLYIELEIKESDIGQVQDSVDGEIAFASRPEDKFKIKIDRIDPVAVAKEEGSVITVRASFEGGYEDWWRPGMTGIGKINAGKRTLLWILVHRTVDFLRMKLWW